MSEFFCRGEKIVLGFGRRQISSDIFDVYFPRNCITALIGPNGAGKTTLLKAMLGEDTLLRGKISLEGTLAYVPQDHRFPPAIRLQDFLRLAYLGKIGFFGKLPAGDHPEIAAALRNFGLAPLKERVLETLSTGERQRAFLARAILQQSDVLLLDEPTNHLDPGGVQRFWDNLLKSRQSRAFEIIVSTHDLTFVEKYCDWVCALKGGSVFFSGPAKRCFAAKIPSSLFDFTDSFS